MAGRKRQFNDNYDEPPVQIPKVITHKNMLRILNAIVAEDEFQPGPGHKINLRGWYRRPVVLEFPLGELAESSLIGETSLKTLALVGRSQHWIEGLTGKERFNAQGLEGKVLVIKDLFGALINMDLLPEHRGRILTRHPALEAGSRPLRSNPAAEGRFALWCLELDWEGEPVWNRVKVGTINELNAWAKRQGLVFVKRRGELFGGYYRSTDARSDATYMPGTVHSPPEY